MLGLDLFSGIGGITKALEGYVQPVAYCENNRYAQAMLLSRMDDGRLPHAPIWDDVTSLRGSMLPTRIDIIYGGFPCQDISIAGRGVGLGGVRSGLFFEIVRLVGEIRPRFIFLENVPAIRLRGADIVVKELARLGYDARWTVISASDVGANHLRKRWWLLAHSRRALLEGTLEQGTLRVEAGKQNADQFERSSKVAHSKSNGMERRPAQFEKSSRREIIRGAIGCRKDVPDSIGHGREGCGKNRPASGSSGLCRGTGGDEIETVFKSGWWTTEPNVGRVAHGVPFRVDRLKGLGNSVVPAQAREAFERLMGLK